MSMKSGHPITPPPELVQQWCDASKTGEMHFDVDDLATRSAQWGADQELEACCEYLMHCAQWEPEDVDELRAARRPKPPSLKQQAIRNFDHLMGELVGTERYKDRIASVRRALEALDD